MKTIIAATDFSVSARNAAHYAADMALALKARLVLYHSYQIPIAYLETPVLFDDSRMMEEAKEEMETLQEILKKRTDYKIMVDTVIKVGDFFEELKRFGETIHPYMVVMGSQGTTAAERFLFGGHAVYAMRHLPFPLITVPIEGSFNGLNKIAIASDFDHIADKIQIAEINKLQVDFGAELHIINTGESDKFDANVVFEAVSLNEMMENSQLKFHFLNEKNTNKGILQFAEDNKIDLLVVFPKTHHLLENILHKSHTKHLVLHSHIPVMALHV